MLKRVSMVLLLVAVCLSSAFAMDVVYSPRVQVGNRLMVPLRGVLESLGFSVEYEKIMDDAMIGIQPVGWEAPSGVTYVELIVGVHEATVQHPDGAYQFWMDVTPQLFGGTTYVPVRFVGEVFGYQVDYHGSYVDFSFGGELDTRLMLTGQRAVQAANPPPAPVEGDTGPWAEWTSWRKAREADFMDHSNWELTVVRNEIYARHGRPFSNPYLRAHFQTRPWYRADKRFSEKRLNATEKWNADFIKKLQVKTWGKAATTP